MPSLAAALKDFGAPLFANADAFAAPPGFATQPDFPAAAATGLPDLIAQPQVDVDALVAEAVAQAEAALAAHLADERDEALQAERDRHAEEMTALQARFADEAGERIRTGLQEMENRVVELTGAVTARILGGVLTDDVRERSIARLAGIVRDALADDDAIRIRVRGNLPLYEALKSRLPEHAEQFDFAEAPGFDLSVAIDDSVFETRLAEWSAALAEALS